jgi:hypothetical protein
MADDLLAGIQPDAGEAAAAPVEPVAPVAPVEPAAPELTEEQQGDAEWDAAQEDLFPGIKKSQEEQDEQTKPTKTAEEIAADEVATTKADADKDPTKPGEKDDAAEGEEDEQADTSDASARLSAREQAAQVAEIKSEIREKLFPDAQTELRAGDGTLLDSVDKVMQYVNPATGEAYTRDEATLWLAQSERALEKSVTDMNAQVEQIADTQLDLKDQADVVNFDYGELLRAMPELRTKLWGEYEKLLTRDPKSGIITKAPISLRNFYETALEPYAELGRKLDAGDLTPAAPAPDPVAVQKAADAEKARRRSDRSDIYGPGKVDTATDEEKEWGAAAEAVFGKIN